MLAELPDHGTCQRDKREHMTEQRVSDEEHSHISTVRMPGGDKVTPIVARGDRRFRGGPIRVLVDACS
jgi:hypothetical protein